MIRLLTDENIDQKILRGLHRRLPLLDFVLARDVGLAAFLISSYSNGLPRSRGPS